MRLGIGIDIGGTNIKAAAFDLDSGRVAGRESVPTGDGGFRDRVPVFAEGVSTIIRDFASAFDRAPEAIGISAPGLANADQTRISYMPGKMHGIEEFDWRRHLGLDAGFPFACLNDAHAALLGEIWQGAATGRRDVVMLTLGTGVGGAIVSGGRLVTGRIGRAGHLGHLSLDPYGEPDICGTPGSIEDAVGNHTVGHRTGGRFASTAALTDAVRAGDPGAIAAWYRSIDHLGAAAVSLINALDPEILLLGGGIAKAGDLLTAPLEAYLERYEWRPGGHRVPIVFATLGEWAGCHGAIYQALGTSGAGAAD